MKRKFCIGLVGLLAIGALTSCGEDNASSSNFSTDEFHEVYEAYKANGGTLSYEEWLASIKGEKGDKGDPGESGKDGADGSKIYTGNGKPSDSLGSAGDIYIDVDTGDLYSKANSWIKTGNIKGEKGDSGVDGKDGVDGSDGVSITAVVRSSSDGNVDTYTISYSDGTESSFTVTNGADGQPGAQGQKGEDGHTPTVTIGENGNWYVDGEDTGHKAQGPQGEKGEKGDDGTDGVSIVGVAKTSSDGAFDTYTITYSDSTTSTFTIKNGADGEDGHTPSITIGENGNWLVDGTDTGTKAQGSQGEQGVGISKVEKTSSEGNVDTYTITYGDGSTSTFKVTNGIDGKTPYIGDDGYWYIGDQNTGVKAQGDKGIQGEKGDKGDKGDPGLNGQDGRSVASIEKTSSSGNVDTYTITYSDGTTGSFTVTNGTDGQDGSQGIQGIQGEKGEDGHTPTVTIGDNGNWYVDGVDTGKSSKGSDGNKIYTGNGAPDDGLGCAGDIYLDSSTGDLYEKTSSWEKAGNVKGPKGEDGEKGDTGSTGKSAYETFKECYPDYEGSEMDWITAVANGDKCALFGHSFDSGVLTVTPAVGVQGKRVYTCSTCGLTKTETLPALTAASGEIYTVDGVEYFNFGSYPKTHVGDADTIAALDSLTETNERGYYEYGGKEYTRLADVQPNSYGTCNTYDEYGYSTGTFTHCYSDGTAIQFGTKEWFVVEPIVWEVVSHDEESGKIRLLSRDILDQCEYYTIDLTGQVKGSFAYNRKINDETVFHNNYKYSKVRAFLNGTSWFVGASQTPVTMYNVTVNPEAGYNRTQRDAAIADKGFLQRAFTSEEQNAISFTEVDNSPSTTHLSTNENCCENTLDRVYLPSYAELSDAEKYPDDNSRLSKTTDFATACSVEKTWQYMGDGKWLENYDNGYYWTRSPCGLSNYGGKGRDLSSGVMKTGEITSYIGVDQGGVGIRPEICIVIS